MTFRWRSGASPNLERTGIYLPIEPLNRQETFFLSTAAEAASLCRAIGHPRVGLMLDTAHMAIEEKGLPGAVLTAGPWLKHLQLPESDRGTPGTGKPIHWSGLFAALSEIDYPGGCAIESFPFPDPAYSMKTGLRRDPAASTDDLAREVLAFLKRMEKQPHRGAISWRWYD